MEYYHGNAEEKIVKSKASPLEPNSYHSSSRAIDQTQNGYNPKAPGLVVLIDGGEPGAFVGIFHFFLVHGGCIPRDAGRSTGKVRGGDTCTDTTA